METLIAVFESHFAHWGIQLPPDEAARRQRGEICKTAWSIRYRFGSDVAGEYIDYYSSHRLPEDSHSSTGVDGGKESLPALRGMFITDQTIPTRPVSWKTLS